VQDLHLAVACAEIVDFQHGVFLQAAWPPR
jgi:hypothetical protein